MKRLTNEQIIKKLMSESQYGALAQGFIINALSEYADKVAAAHPNEFSGTLVNGDAWVGVAREIKEKLDRFYAPNSKE